MHLVSSLTFCAQSAGLSGTDLSFLWLLQGGQNTLSKDNLQFAAGLPAGHHSLPVPQPHLDCEKVLKRQNHKEFIRTISFWMRC